jgi:hypothetical protein
MVLDDSVGELTDAVAVAVSAMVDCATFKHVQALDNAEITDLSTAVSRRSKAVSRSRSDGVWTWCWASWYHFISCPERPSRLTFETLVTRVVVIVSMMLWLMSTVDPA